MTINLGKLSIALSIFLFIVFYFLIAFFKLAFRFIYHSISYFNPFLVLISLNAEYFVFLSCFLNSCIQFECLHLATSDSFVTLVFYLILYFFHVVEFLVLSYRVLVLGNNLFQFHLKFVRFLLCRVRSFAGGRNLFEDLDLSVFN